MSKRASNVVRYSDYEPAYNPAVRRDEPATVIVLPVIRIERRPDGPARKSPSARLRALRKRGAPSVFVDKPCDT